MIAHKPTSLSSLRKKSRFILEKFKDLCRPRKFQKIISKKNITPASSKTIDIQIAIEYILKSYECYLIPQQNINGFPKRKQLIFYGHLKNLNIKIAESSQSNKPVNKKYVTNVLKAQTIFFNSLYSKKINKDCKDCYDKLILSAVSVWNNDWAIG